MASAAVSATMAAAGFDKRASAASSLQTPGSGTFPSELRSPLVGSPGFLKSQDLRTPITPPSAYLDFLKSMSPALISPAPSGISRRFSFTEKAFDKASEPFVEKSSSETPANRPSVTPPKSQSGSLPPLSRNTSFGSNASTATNSTDQSAASQPSNASTASATSARPESPRVIIPPAQFVKPGPKSASARTPRRLHIPQSPYSTGMPSAGLPSAQSMPSPYSSTPLSAAPWSASFSPQEVDPEVNGKPGKVSVRQVVTRTVTYCRTPLEPAPKGKRRKIEVETETESSDISNASSEEPPIKQEKQEKCTKTTEDSIRRMQEA